MLLNPAPTELTTAATDAALGLLCAGLLLQLRRTPTPTAFRKRVWTWVFGLIVLASALGAVVHGLALPERASALLRLPLSLSLGLAVALFLVGAVADWRGETAARALVPWAAGLGAGFFAVSETFRGAFLVFVAYEAAALSAALAMYLHLALTGRRSGAGLVATGITLSLVAAALQASRLTLRLIVPFDHNGIFHLVQMISIVVVARGVRQGLDDRDGSSETPRATGPARG